MRRLAACTLVLVSCSGVDPARPQDVATSANAPAARWDAAQGAALQRDLAVVLTRSGAGELDADDDWPLTATLVNRGDAAHWLVRPDDGSSVGWREPHVYYTAEMETTPGVWRPVAQADYARCGLYATDWYADVMELAPGASLDVGTFAAAPVDILDFPRSGAVRLYAHYDYDGGRKSSFRRAGQPAALPAQLEGLGPFALVSAPLELRIRVDTSAELVFALRRTQVRVGEELSLASLGEATIVSHAGEALDLGEDFPDSRFRLEAREEDRWYEQALDGPHLLAPRERVALSAAQPARGFASEAPGAMRVRVRYDAALMRRGAPALRRYRSPWLTIRVVQ